MTTHPTVHPGEEAEPRLFPAWYHESNLELAEQQIASDVAQRAALVAWIADLDERISRQTTIAHEHREALRTGQVAK